MGGDRAISARLLDLNRVCALAVAALLVWARWGMRSPDQRIACGVLLGSLLSLRLLLEPALNYSIEDLDAERVASGSMMVRDWTAADSVVAVLRFTPLPVGVAILGCVMLGIGAGLRLPGLASRVARWSGVSEARQAGATREVEREFGPRWGHVPADRRVRDSLD